MAVAAMSLAPFRREARGWALTVGGFALAVLWCYWALLVFVKKEAPHVHAVLPGFRARIRVLCWGKGHRMCMRCFGVFVAG